MAVAERLLYECSCLNVVAEITERNCNLNTYEEIEVVHAAGDSSGSISPCLLARDKP